MAYESHKLHWQRQSNPQIQWLPSWRVSTHPLAYIWIHTHTYTHTHTHIYIHTHKDIWTSLVTQMVKNLPAMQEIRVQSLDWEDSLEKEMATHSVFLPGEFHGHRSLAGYNPWGCRVRHDWATNTIQICTYMFPTIQLFIYYFGEQS